MHASAHAGMKDFSVTTEKEDIIKKVQCPSCGAPIVWAEGKSSMQCPYCNTGLERVLPPRKESDDFTTPAPPKIVIQSAPITVRPHDAVKVATAASGASACSTVGFV